MQPTIPIKSIAKVRHQYSILLTSGTSVVIPAETWEAIYTEDGSVTAYYFYIDKRKILSLDAVDVRSIGDAELVATDTLHKALTKTHRRKKKVVGE
jgi:hypothetical protein